MGFALPCSTSPQAAEESGISWEGATGLRGILKECKRLGAHLSAGDRWHARLHCVAVNTDYEQEVKNMQQAALLHGSFIHLSHSGQLLWPVLGQALLYGIPSQNNPQDRKPWLCAELGQPRSLLHTLACVCNTLTEKNNIKLI